ncbi:MAG TPA: nicotinamide riboside transporter PnuC [Prosthecobacter sp.]
MTPLEISANAFTALCIILAGRNNVHTWWAGIVGCLLFGWLFYDSQLYADAMLQVFFVVTGVIGWRKWMRGEDGSSMPIRRTNALALLLMTGAGLLVAAGHGWLLHRFTNAFAPVPDSLVLVFSVIAQLLMMDRRLESWHGWLIVNTISVPLFYQRGLYLTAVLYAVFWINALVSLRHWRRLMKA